MLAWALQKKYIIIPRTTNIDHLIENLESVNISLSNDIIKQLDDLNENFVTHPRYI